MAEAELKRRNPAGALVDWKVADDAESPTQISEPVLEPVLRERIDIALSALRNALAGSGAGAKTLADVVAALQAGINLSQTSLDALENITVGGTVSLSSASLAALEEITATLAAGGVLTANQGAAGAQEWAVKDQLDGFDAPDDQAGDGTVRTFDFSAPVELVWVRVVGGIGRASPASAVVPAMSKGVYCAADEPTPITCVTSQVKVWAPGGTVVSVWAFRR